MLVAERARWRETAEGILEVEAARLGCRLGLTSVLLLRERKPGLVFVPGVAAVRWGGRAGEASREDSGEVAEEGEPETLSERAPDRAGCRIDAGDAESDAAAGPFWLWLVGAGACCEVPVAGVDAGSADSRTPVRDWKPSASLVEVMLVVMGLLQRTGARVACCARMGLQWLGQQRAPRSLLAVKDAHALPPGTRQAVVGQRRSAGTLLAEQGHCGGAQTVGGALAARDAEGVVVGECTGYV